MTWGFSFDVVGMMAQIPDVLQMIDDATLGTVNIVIGLVMSGAAIGSLLIYLSRTGAK
jgi:hypothetical protein